MLKEVLELKSGQSAAAVLVGDFRTHLDAYREVQMIKADYPLATIVPAKIEPPAID